MDLKEKEISLKEAITPFIQGQGLDVFEARLLFVEGKLTLRILVDYPKGGVTLDECVRLNRSLSDYLDSRSVLEESFLLEVSSPGIKRDLTTLKDFLRIKGKAVSVWLTQELEGKTHYDGDVVDVDFDKQKVFLTVKDQKISLPIDVIKKAKQRIA